MNRVCAYTPLCVCVRTCMGTLSTPAVPLLLLLPPSLLSFPLSLSRPTKTTSTADPSSCAFLSFRFRVAPPLLRAAVRDARQTRAVECAGHCRAPALHASDRPAVLPSICSSTAPCARRRREREREARRWWDSSLSRCISCGCAGCFAYPHCVPSIATVGISRCDATYRRERWCLCGGWRCAGASVYELLALLWPFHSLCLVAQQRDADLLVLSPLRLCIAASPLEVCVRRAGGAAALHMCFLSGVCVRCLPLRSRRHTLACDNLQPALWCAPTHPEAHPRLRPRKPTHRYMHTRGDATTRGLR